MTETTKQTNIFDDIRKAIEAAPSRAALIAAEKKSAELGAKRTETEVEISQLIRELRAGKDEPTARATELLEGKQLSDNPLSVDLGAARRRLATLAQAIAQLQRTIRELRTRVTGEVNVSLRPARQALVTRMSAAITTLRAGASEDDAVRAELQRGGVDVAMVDVLGFAGASGERDDLSDWWRSARIAQGYTL
jgi:hypothetical protein